MCMQSAKRLIRLSFGPYPSGLAASAFVFCFRSRRDSPDRNWGCKPDREKNPRCDRISEVGKGSGAVLDTPLVIPNSQDDDKTTTSSGRWSHRPRAESGQRPVGYLPDRRGLCGIPAQRVIAEAVVRHHMRLRVYCLVPNHFHLLLWPRQDDDLSAFMRWLTMTHTQRWHAHHRTAGTGHLDQRRFKSFSVQSDEHFLRA